MFDLTHKIKQGTNYNIIKLSGTHNYDVFAHCSVNGFCDTDWCCKSYEPQHYVIEDAETSKAFKGQKVNVTIRDDVGETNLELAVVYPKCTKEVIGLFPTGELSI